MQPYPICRWGLVQTVRAQMGRIPHCSEVPSFFCFRPEPFLAAYPPPPRSANGTANLLIQGRQATCQDQPSDVS